MWVKVVELLFLLLGGPWEVDGKLKLSRRGEERDMSKLGRFEVERCISIDKLVGRNGESFCC